MNLKFSLLALIFSGMFVVSCTDSTESPDSVEDYVEKSIFEMDRSVNAGRKGCFELVFPLSINFPDETQEEVESYEELKAAIQAWKEANPDAETRPTLAFPIEVIDKNGDIISVDNKEELVALKIECRREWYNNHGPNGHHGDACFRLVYPLTIVFPNGNTLEVENRRQLKTAIRVWKHNNPNADVRPMLQFPIQVKQDGEIIDVDTKEELIALKEAC